MTQCDITNNLKTFQDLVYSERFDIIVVTSVSQQQNKFTSSLYLSKKHYLLITKYEQVSTYNKVFYELLFTSNEVQFLLKYSLFYFVLLWLNFGKVKKFKFIL